MTPDLGASTLQGEALSWQAFSGTDVKSITLSYLNREIFQSLFAHQEHYPQIT